MLDHLRQKAAQTLASVDSVILSSFGPADIQVSRVPSFSDDLKFYVLIPNSSDHLFNLEHRSEVVVSTDGWEFQGNARILALDEVPVVIRFSHYHSNTNSSVSPSGQIMGGIVEIRPTRLTFHSPSGQGNLETIDF